MQNAKDTFYDMLRGRLATCSPDRTVVVRGVTRPAVLVAENELPMALGIAAPAQEQLDCFILRWTTAVCDNDAALQGVAMTCEITYATAGTQANGGMDRGRMLACLDAELLGCLHAMPQSTALLSFREGAAATACGSNLWWGDPELGEVQAKGDRLQRVATVAVMSLQQAGAA